jgi:hypothetical protein
MNWKCFRHNANHTRIEFIINDLFRNYLDQDFLRIRYSRMRIRLFKNAWKFDIFLLFSGPFLSSYGSESIDPTEFGTTNPVETHVGTTGQNARFLDKFHKIGIDKSKRWIRKRINVDGSVFWTVLEPDLTKP